MESPQRILSAYGTSASNMTQEICVGTCAGKGYRYAGTEYGVQCFCDNVLRANQTGLVGDGQCNMLCGGNAGEYCGAGNRVGVWVAGGN